MIVVTSQIPGMSSALYDGMRDRWSGAYASLNLAVVARYREQWSDVAKLLDETLTVAREVGDQPLAADTLFNLGILALCVGELARAEARHREALALFQRLGLVSFFAQSLREFGGLALAQGYPMRAARLLGAAEALREKAGRSLSPVEHARYDRDIRSVADALGHEAFHRYWAEGRALHSEDAVSEALRK